MSTKAFDSRFYEPDLDLKVVERWWAAHEMPVDIGSVLPEEGIIIPNLCAAWIYLASNSDLAWIAWMVGNPEAAPRDVHNGLCYVIEELKAYAKECGMKIVTAYTDHTGLVKLFNRCGFEATPNKSTSLWVRV